MQMPNDDGAYVYMVQRDGAVRYSVDTYGRVVTPAMTLMGHELSLVTQTIDGQEIKYVSFE